MDISNIEQVSMLLYFVLYIRTKKANIEMLAKGSEGNLN